MHIATLSEKQKGLIYFKMKKKYTFSYTVGLNGVQEIYLEWLGLFW